ncbi:FecR family protein [Sphingobium rhizovicinum]|uniref:FecR family protein n=1 Tax=Sphingobium rhizovicinum TaxID=432308 RepID=A0ABV7NBC5_9SPHN
MTARADFDEAMLDQAIAWQAALEHDDADWDGYLAWLEANPRHREAFDSIALVDAAVREHRDVLSHEPSPPVAEIDPRHRWKPRLVMGGALAACLALAVALPTFWQTSRPIAYSNEGSAPRMIALASGTSVTLSPGSAILVSAKNDGQIELAKGEAYFDVRHDPSRVLTVSAGNYRVTDIGTRFSVNLANSALRVGVAQGAVSVAGAQTASAVRVDAGHQLVGKDGLLTLSTVEPSQVGSWRSGRLTYTNAPLAMVAGDIERYSGKRISVDFALENKHFSGILVIGDGSKLASDLAAVMGLEVRQQGDLVHIAAGR